MNAIEKLLTIKQNWTDSRKPIPDEWIAEWQENPTVGLVRTATAELAAKNAQIEALKKLLSRVEVAFRCDLSQPEANDYYWNVRQQVDDELKREKELTK
jgi:hypothetical protein